MRNKLFIYGAIFGLIIPIIGLFIGLQVHPVLGDILMFPFILLSKFTQEPFGNWSIILKGVGFLISMLFWGIIFVLPRIVKKEK